LLAAPRFDKGAEIRHRGSRAPSGLHIAMTVAMLRDAGAEVETWTQGPGRPAGQPDTWHVHPGVIGHHEVIVQPDLSNAVPFLARRAGHRGPGADRGVAGGDLAARRADP